MTVGAEWYVFLLCQLSLSSLIMLLTHSILQKVGPASSLLSSWCLSVWSIPVGVSVRSLSVSLWMFYVRISIAVSLFFSLLSGPADVNLLHST